MSLDLYWFLPTHGDGRTISRRSTGRGGAVQRAPDLTYLAQVCGAVEQHGFTGMLVPAGLFCEDPWLVSVALAQRSNRVRFMVALRPSLLSPTLAAQMAATAQRLSGDRFDLNLVVGGDPDEQARYGSWLAHDARYTQAEEFLTVVRGAWSGRPTDLTGEHVRVRQALLVRPARRAPRIFLGGSSPAAVRAAAAQADVYLAWGEDPAALAGLFGKVTERGRELGRHVALGTRFHVITRDTAAEAWAVAERLVADLDPEMVAAAQARGRRSESVGQQRMALLHGGDTGRLEIHPNVWAGFGLLRPGAGAALVGSHAQVADRIAEFHALGVEHLILSGQPHLEEAHTVGEGLLPLLRERGLLGGQARLQPAGSAR
jgi:alkanesulfonate monooxygenase